MTAMRDMFGVRLTTVTGVHVVNVTSHATACLLERYCYDITSGSFVSDVGDDAVGLNESIPWLVSHPAEILLLLQRRLRFTSGHCSMNGVAVQAVYKRLVTDTIVGNYGEMIPREILQPSREGISHWWRPTSRLWKLQDRSLGALDIHGLSQFCR